MYVMLIFVLVVSRWISFWVLGVVGVVVVLVGVVDVGEVDMGILWRRLLYCSEVVILIIFFWVC